LTVGGWQLAVDQLLDQFVCHSYPRKGAEWMFCSPLPWGEGLGVRSQEVGVDDGEGVGQGFGQFMVIGDDHVYAAGLGVSHGLVFGDAGVAGE